MAIEGEASDPRIAAPAALRPVLGFRRLSASSYRTIGRVIDDDGTFRSRVAEAAPEEATVGRVGWLWLHRPVGWVEDPAFATKGTGAEVVADPPAPRDTTAKHRRAAKDAEAARRAAADEAAALRKEVRRLEQANQVLEGQVGELEEQRQAAVRSTKALEHDLAAARRDLKVARTATRQAEAELAAERRAVADASPESVASPAPDAPVSPAASSVDAGAVAHEVRSAAQAAAALAASLERAAGALSPPPPAPAPAQVPSRSRARSTEGSKRRHRPRSRAAVALPPGVFDGTAEADRHVIGDGANLLVIDGYNLAKTAWGHLAPEEERRRTVSLLEEVQARSGGGVVVVFDGDDAVVAPAASRSVRVRYSSTGQTADDAIGALLATVALERPVVVVSSDRAVAADARAHGATPMASRAFLTATGR